MSDLTGQNLQDEMDRVDNIHDPEFWGKLACNPEIADTEHDLIWIGWEDWDTPLGCTDCVATMMAELYAQ